MKMKTEELKKETDKWEERHFQLCLAFISRVEHESHFHSKPIKLSDVINKADRMVALLKERAERMGGEL